MNEKDMKALFSCRLEKLLVDREMRQNDLANILGVSESTVGKWILQKSLPRMGIIQKLSDYFHVNKSYFLELNQKNVVEKQKGIKIPILGRVVAGTPIEAITDIEGYEEITPKMAATGNFFALRVKGHSMEPYMLPDDIVIVRRQEDVECGDIAIILVNGEEATVKRIQKTKEGVTLIGMNPSVYPPHFYTNQQILSLPVTVIGRVMEIRRSV